MLSIEERSFVGRHSVEVDNLESLGENQEEKFEEEEKLVRTRGRTREPMPEMSDADAKKAAASAKRAAERERARIGREKRLKALADSGKSILKESLVGVGDSSRVAVPDEIGVASTTGAIKATPINSAPPATKCPSTASSPSSVDRGKEQVTGEEKVTTVNFSLPSDFLSGNVLNGTNLLPHVDKFLLPSFRERFEGLPIGERGSHAAGWVFLALQAMLSLRGGAAEIGDHMAAAREREKEALDRAEVSANRAENFSKCLNEALDHLKVVHADKEDPNRRLSQALSTTTEQKEMIRKIEESLAATSKEVEVRKLKIEELEKKMQVAEDESKSIFSLDRMTARAAIMRQHLRGKNPLASAQEELDAYLKEIGAERDLDSDDEKEEAMVDAGP